MSIPTNDPIMPLIAPPMADPSIMATSVSTGCMSTELDMIFGDTNV